MFLGRTGKMNETGPGDAAAAPSVEASMHWLKPIAFTLGRCGLTGIAVGPFVYCLAVGKVGDYSSTLSII
jgi:hypothetical protein